jgi:hypothetical protein
MFVPLATSQNLRPHGWTVLLICTLKEVHIFWVERLYHEIALKTINWIQTVQAAVQ